MFHKNGSIVLKPEQGRDGSPGWQDRRTLLSIGTSRKKKMKPEYLQPNTTRTRLGSGSLVCDPDSDWFLFFFIRLHVRLLTLNVGYHQIHTWWLHSEHIQQQLPAWQCQIFSKKITFKLILALFFIINQLMIGVRMHPPSCVCYLVLCFQPLNPPPSPPPQLLTCSHAHMLTCCRLDWVSPTVGLLFMVMESV